MLDADVTIDVPTISAVVFAFFLMAFTKGAFGGGFGVIGIPFLALVMDLIVAGALIATLNIVADVGALRYWRPTTWSRPDVAILAPSLVLGIALGFILLSVVSRDLVAVVIAIIVLVFVAMWARGAQSIKQGKRSFFKGALAGVASGFTSMTAHAGGPPIAMYLLPLGLDKSIYAGTTFVVFAGVNLLKVGPWIMLVDVDRNFVLALLIALPAIVLGLEAGWRLHHRVSQRQLYNTCYALLSIVAVKLLWDSVVNFSNSNVV